MAGPRTRRRVITVSIEAAVDRLREAGETEGLVRTQLILPNSHVEAASLHL